MEWKVVAQCQSELEAQIIAGKLKNANIQVKLDSSSLSDMYPGTILAGPIQVYVSDNDFELAQKLLAEDL